MPTFQKKTVVKSYKLRIKKKFKILADETNDAVTKLQECVSVFEKQLEELLKKSDENFLGQYQKLTEDFESYQEKLCYFLTAIENTADDREDSESDENLLTEDTSESPSHPISSENPLESKSSLLSSSYHSTQDNRNTTGSQLVSGSDQKEDVVPPTNTEKNSHKHEEPLPVQETEPFLPETNPLTLNQEHTGCKSVSQNSCYRSLSSDSSELLLSISSHVLDYPISANTQIKQLEISESLEDEIPPCEVPLNAVVSASLTHIVNPSDFWMQLQTSQVNNMVFPLSEFHNDKPPVFMKKGDFCLAPFKFLHFYYRAKALSDAFGCEDIEVLFVDHGSVQKMSLNNLRNLPTYAYKIPLQAFHCKLFNVLPVDQVWTPEAGEKLKGFQNNHIETLVKSFESDTYAVQLTANISSSFFDDEFSCDIAETLCLDGLAVLEMDSQLDQKCCVTENSNQTSCDSGVSVSSNPTASAFQNHSFSSDTIGRGLPFNASETLYVSQNKNHQTPGTAVSEQTCNQKGISFDGSDAIHDSNEAASFRGAIVRSGLYQLCSRSEDCDCMLHVTVPPPRISFVQMDMMIVMLSHITSPSEFYVNLAMEESLSLDELQEKMTIFYENDTSLNIIHPSCLSENMFCAGRYDQDNNWYRVVILSSEHQNEESSEVYLQFIDYGNKEFVKCTDLRPLLPEFATYPSFSIKCSLAGIMPKCSDPVSSCNSFHWSKAAITKFQQLVNFNRCLTAQICESPLCSSPILEGEPIQVLLWDTEGSEDLLINRALFESGFADFDTNFMHKLQIDDTFSAKEKTFLQYWDPMNDEYHNITNSYGVDTEDTEIAVSGYKQKDEDYICHSFALRGYCPRKHCPYEHIEFDSGGCTRDQDEVYSMDLVPLLPDVPSHVLATVSAIKSPGLFYSVLPFGKNTVDDVDLLHLTEPLECKKYRDEVDALYKGVNEHYAGTPFVENTTVALAYGSIVAAYHEGYKTWQRGRIVEVSDITGPCRVFFVDFGDECWVPRKGIRQILPEFLFTHFQAIECRLSDIEPLGFEKGEKWSIQAINRFKELVTNEVMLAHITFRCGNALHVKLRSTTEKNHREISDILVEEGFAQYVTSKPTKIKGSKYVPG